MRKALIIYAMVLFPAVAIANPVSFGSGTIASGIVVAAALIVEVMATALVLICFGMASTYLVAALLFSNALLYLTVFLLLLEGTESVPLAEAVIVAMDALVIVLLSRFEVFQGSAFTRLLWWQALLASIVGNASSFGVGLLLR